MNSPSMTVHDPHVVLPPDLNEVSDPLLQVSAELEYCAQILELEDWILLRLRQPEQETSLHAVFPSAAGNSQRARSAGVSPAVKAGVSPAALSGSGHPVTALWVRHSSVLGAPIVPLAIAGDDFLNSVRARAMRTTWSASLFGVDAGGGAAAIILDPNRYREDELREATRRIAYLMAPFCPARVPHLPQPADTGSFPTIIPDRLNSIEMEWLNAAFRTAGNTYTKIAGRLYGPPSLPETDTIGSVENATAFCLLQLIGCAAGRLHGLRVAIQGFDPICQNLAHRLQRTGARLVALADLSGAICDPLGLNTAALIAYAGGNDLLFGYPAAEAILNADLLEYDCDVLVLASGPRQISSHNASRIRARVVVEAVAGAITPAAKAELSAAGVTIVSDLVSAGPRLLYYATESERTVLGARPAPWLRRRIRHTWTNIRSAAEKWRVAPHNAAELLAISRVAEVLRARGI